MGNYKKYTADMVGSKWDGFKQYIMVIITKWKDTTKDSPEEGHKAYYFRSGAFQPTVLDDEKSLKYIYENYPANARLETRVEVKVYAEE